MERHKPDRIAAVLAYYDQHRVDFPLVIRDMIEEEDTYKLTHGQEPRDFKTKLVAKMLKHWLRYEHDRDALRNKIAKLS